MNDNRIYWVRGNTQELLIPLEQEIVPQEGEVEVVPYYPDAEATVQVRLVGKYRKLSYTPTVDGNLLRLTENATLPSGVYGVEVVVENPDGTRYRSLWDNQIVVTDQNDSVLQEWDEFKQLNAKARAAVFFFAKGDKGDKGDRGVSIASIRQIETSEESGGINVIRVTLDNGEHSDFTVMNGKKPEFRVEGKTLILS